MLVIQTVLIWVRTYLVAVYWFGGKELTLFSLIPMLIIFFPPVLGITGINLERYSNVGVPDVGYRRLRVAGKSRTEGAMDKPGEAHDSRSPAISCHVNTL